MPVKIFFCYARNDSKILEELRKYLKSLEHEGLVEMWSDHDITPGTEWERGINENLNTAQIILLLISPDFMNSNYCFSIEMKKALERHERGEARVIPIILYQIHWQIPLLSKLQALPPNAKPVNHPSWNTRDRAFDKIAEGIRKAINELAGSRSNPISTFVENPAKTETSIPTSTTEQSEVRVATSTALNQSSPTTSINKVTTNSSPNTVQTSEAEQISQKQPALSEVLQNYRSRLERMEVTIDLGSHSDLTEEFARGLDQLLREIIATFRTMQPRARTENVQIRSEDEVLKNLRQARNFVRLAFDALTHPLLSTLSLRSNKSEGFYQNLASCREYLEKALENW